MSQDKREFEVELVVTSRHRIITYSRNADEAERDAEELFEDGEEGTLVSFEIELAEAWPAEEDVVVELDDEDDDSGE